MPLKAVLRDLEWNIFIVAQPWWATFKISFVVIFTRQFHDQFWKVKSNPALSTDFPLELPMLTYVQTIVDILVLGQTCPAGVG